MATTQVPAKQSVPVPVGAPDAWRSFRTELDRLFDRFNPGSNMLPFPAFRFESSFGVPSPAVDITEDDTSFKLSAELPGMTEKNIDVSLSGNTLTIKGEKHQEKEEKKQDYCLTERSFGEFRRSFTLPDSVDGGKIAASFANGVLTVTVPKTAKTTPTKIEVRAAS